MKNYGPMNPRSRIEYMKEIDVMAYQRYKHAALIQVTGGRGDLCRKGDAGRYRVSLEGFPVCEVQNFKNPSISPWLKPEDGVLLKIRQSFERRQSDDFFAYLENSYPLLACLEDGYYVILDALLYPATGNQDFFLEVYGTEQMDSLLIPDGDRPFPMYIYPSAPEPPHLYSAAQIGKAISYYLQGYLSLLLVGHDLAVDAAIKGKFLSSLVIVPCTELADDGAYFADIFIPDKEFPTKPEAYHIRPASLRRRKHSSKNHCRLSYRSLWKQYPLIKQRQEPSLGASKDIKTTRLVFKNVDDKLHYKGALAVQVENGKSRLVKKGDLNTFYKLDFKGEPLMQVYDFWEDDRSHIAPAFGMAEDSEEIRQAVRNINNMEGQNIRDYAESISPLLELLPDGEYVLVDTMLYPSNGTGFFWNVTNYPILNKALEEPEMGFPYPAYIYPTLHPGCYDSDLKDSIHCAKMLDDSSSGRAICYYLQGYMTALLYGHDMAVMAAYSHKELPALVIIPYCDLVASNNKETLGRFADIVIPIWDADQAEENKTIKEIAEYKPRPEIGLMKPWDKRCLESWRSYPTPEQLMAESELGIQYG